MPDALPVETIELLSSLPAEAAALVRVYQRARRPTRRSAPTRRMPACSRTGVPGSASDPYRLRSEAVAAFIVAEAEAGRAASTLGRRLAAIRYAHKLAKLPDPTDDEGVHAAMKGARRKLTVAPKQKAAATAEILASLLMRTPDTLTGKRDRALLALGFAGAFRRSELVALDVEDLREDPEGLRVMVRRSKVDQEGRGFEKAIPHGRFIRPVALVREWLDAAGITSGPVFRPVSRSGRVRSLQAGNLGENNSRPASPTDPSPTSCRATARPRGSMPRRSGRTPCGPATSRRRPSAGRISLGSWISPGIGIRGRSSATSGGQTPSRGTQGVDFCDVGLWPGAQSKRLSALRCMVREEVAVTSAACARTPRYVPVSSYSP